MQLGIGVLDIEALINSQLDAHLVPHIPDVVLCRATASKEVGHAARGFSRLGSLLGIAYMHAHHCGCCESTPDIFLRLGEHDVHLPMKTNNK